ncbi:MULTISPECIES: serine/threonine-protein kinase [Streptosporangium]|uniref:Serine/threonine protein kinase n=1 Tax=Streptosporangium brasiliense TaxID=47480 RepID=A0ABT9R3M1_9ACTN|nr:serine/threonine-protein kinase [Streptosporangium brasiliense]MDP9863838.1 serine/threonine protein kinase [Streptosporangium brasiliense]
MSGEIDTVDGGIQPLLPHDPQQIGPYRLAGRLGVGGMGIVYAGTDKSNHRVAVKTVHPELAHDPEFIVRFAREVKLLSRIQGRGTVKILGADTDDARPWLATEYVPGPTLEQRISAGGPLSGGGLIGLAAGLAEGIHAMHRAGVVHRDLKPGNIILSPLGPRIVDLGIARAVDGTKLTRSGVLIGSPMWMSPEQYGGGEAGPATDVYAWGLIVIYASSGELPFGNARPELLAHRILNNRVNTESVPRSLAGLVGRAVSKNPEERPPVDQIIGSVLRGTTDGESAGSPSEADAVSSITSFIDGTWRMPVGEDPAWKRHDESLARTRRKRISAIAAFGVATLGAAAALWLNYFQSTSSPAQGLPDGSSTMKQAVPSVSDRPESPPQTSPTPAPKPTPTPTPEPEPAALKGKLITLKSGLRFTLPAGWQVSYDESDSSGSTCVQPKSLGNATCMESGIAIIQGLGEDAQNFGSTWALYGDMGQLEACFTSTQGGEDDVTTRTVSTATRSFGNKTALYREFSVRCPTGYTFSPRVWWLPRTSVALTTTAIPRSHNSTVDQISRSFDFRHYRAPG